MDINTTYNTVTPALTDQLPKTIEPAFISSTLKPYRKNATYLLSAEILNFVAWQSEPDLGKKLIKSKGIFSIPESCYIDDTGHFNAVEFNICYNQLAYVTFGYCIKEGIMDIIYPEWGKLGLSYEVFLRKQLSSMLIVKIDGKFTKPLDAKRFAGDFWIDHIFYRHKTSFASTHISFSDEEGNNKSSGSVLLAFNALQ